MSVALKAIEESSFFCSHSCSRIHAIGRHGVCVMPESCEQCGGLGQIIVEDVLYVLPREATLPAVRSLHRQAVLWTHQNQGLGKFVGLMKRAVAMEQKQAMEAEQKKLDRFASTIVIGACIIAAIRLAREENICRSSPKLYSAIGDSIALARTLHCRPDLRVPTSLPACPATRCGPAGPGSSSSVFLR